MIKLPNDIFRFIKILLMKALEVKGQQLTFLYYNDIYK